ncbi:MAG: hypothetical protein KGL12_14675 [Rhodospirillales bacterium]|nr:hypothetical protein [Rhodospirillales bacterium]
MPVRKISLATAPAALIALVGSRRWASRIAALRARAAEGSRAGKVLMQRHAVEFALHRLAQSPAPGIAQPADARIAALAMEAVALSRALPPAGQARLAARLDAALSGEATLIPFFHILRSAALQRARGFEISYSGLAEEAPFDLLLTRGAAQAELACDVISAEEGREVHRGTWFRLADRVDPDLQTWLAAHPGRYLLKMTLPDGLREAGPDSADPLAALHGAIRAMLEGQTRQTEDAAAVLRLDPLLLAGAQAAEAGLMGRLRREFGPEAHLSVTAAGGGVFVMAARAGRENEVAAAVRRRLASIAPVRLSGARPGILAMFIEDTDRAEWRGLRERLELEGEARQFLTHPAARPVVAVTCTSRLELFGLPAPDAVAEGELRFRNPAHPAARTLELAPAVASSV